MARVFTVNSVLTRLSNNKYWLSKIASDLLDVIPVGNTLKCSLEVKRPSHRNAIYCIPINDTSFELSVFWPSDTESQINELRFSDSISLSFKRRLKSVTCFMATLRKINFKH